MCSYCIGTPVHCVMIIGHAKHATAGIDPFTLPMHMHIVILELLGTY